MVWEQKFKFLFHLSQMNKQLKILFQQPSKKLLLLDYDGTLVNHVPLPELAFPNKTLRAIISTITQEKNCKVIIITGRRHDDIERLIGEWPVDIIAEHGAMLRENNMWSELLRDDGGWRSQIMDLFKTATNKCEWSFIEEKKISIAWHYRNTANWLGKTVSRNLIDELLSKEYINDFKILDNNKVVEVMSKNANKGKALEHILSRFKFDLIVIVGDDKTDEDMFEVLAKNPNGFTIKVGQGNTLAKYRLQSVREVIALLRKLVE